MTVVAKLQTADKGGWIQTYSGRTISPGNPSPDDIHIEDIANALARQCRYGGHCLRYLSVAEHCVHVSDAASINNKFSALMHDASEAYLLDIPRPIKPLLVNYYELEDRMMKVIAKKFNFSWPPPEEVKHLDASIITDEREQNMAALNVSNELWGSPHIPLGITLQFWSPEKAAFEFLSRFYRLGGNL